nr:hypothetical protein [endosymbiont of Lamellibrachia barhami]
MPDLVGCGCDGGQCSALHFVPGESNSLAERVVVVSGFGGFNANILEFKAIEQMAGQFASCAGKVLILPVIT